MGRFLLQVYVMDVEEEAHWIQVQKKTFTKWVNQQIAPIGVVIQDLYTDFKSGENLVTLLQVLYKEPIVA